MNLFKIMTSMGKRKLILVLFVHVCLFDLRFFDLLCFLFLLVHCIWKVLWLVVLALPGLFSYLFFFFFSYGNELGCQNTRDT